MFQECKRLLNGLGAVMTGPSTAMQAEVVDLLQVTAVPPALNPGSQRSGSHVYPHEIPDNDLEPDPAGDIAASEAELQVFKATTTNRDDWLHRGFALLDVDWYSYGKYSERV